MVKHRLEILFDQNTYIAGGPLTGLLVFHAADEYRASGIEVGLRANEWVNFGSVRDERLLYEDSYFLYQPSLMEESTVATSKTTSTKTTDTSGGFNALHKGRHVFPFSFNLPLEGLPSSCVMGKRCGIQYLITAHCRHLDKDKELTIWREANVVENLSMLKDVEQPRTANAFKHFNAEQQSLTVDVQTNKTWYMAGEPVFIAMIINNLSDERVRSIKARFVQHIGGKIAEYQKTKDVFEQLFEWGDLEVLPFSQRRMVLEIQAPREARSIWNCSLFSVDWFLHLSFTDSSSIENIKIDIPLRIVPAASYNSMFFPSLSSSVCPMPVPSAAPVMQPQAAAAAPTKKEEMVAAGGGKSLTSAAGVPVVAVPSGMTSSVVITGAAPVESEQYRFFEGSYLYRPSERKHSITGNRRPSQMPPPLASAKLPPSYGLETASTTSMSSSMSGTSGMGMGGTGYESAQMKKLRLEDVTTTSSAPSATTTSMGGSGRDL